MAYYDHAGVDVDEEATDASETDLRMELATCAFGDMLLDDDRNRRYRRALASVIAEKHASGERAYVVDIGAYVVILPNYVKYRNGN